MSAPMYYREYHWLHLESGKTGTKMFADNLEALRIYPLIDLHGAFPELDALRLINQWNCDPRWKYWVAP